MRRTLTLCALLALVALVVSCGGSNSLDDSEAAVYLVADVDLYNPEVPICLQPGIDVTITNLSITSNARSPSATLGSAQDVTLTRWVVTPYRTDGGATASPQWINDISVFVPAQGNANLNNYRVMPAEYFNQLPLSNLLPENGGFDPETGNINIRQSLTLEIFGRTMSGRTISTNPVSIAFNFTCQ